ncbi:hypothetical protein HDV03_001433 [Kappamyces sp. JEL0829]|nr:hypothetical protein HDV03_001433 [Kappamyces sp. JEL0829]
MKQKPKATKSVFSIPVFWSIGIRLALWAVDSSLWMLLDDRVEVVTPVNSFKRCIPPYQGGVLHQSPLLLALFAFVSALPAQLSAACVGLLWIGSDYLIARCLVALAEYKVETFRQEVWIPASVAEEEDDTNTLVGTVDEVENEACIPKMPVRPYEDPLEDTSLHPKVDSTLPIDIPVSPEDIGSIYLLNPFSIITCLSRSTQIFSTLSMAGALFFACKGNRRASMLSLSFGTYLSLYPALLVAPCVLFLNEFNEKKRTAQAGQDKDAITKKESIETLKTTIVKSIAGLAFYTAGLLYLSFLLVGDWSFIRATYGVLIFVDDLRPNVGLFWYFFMEVFDQFRTFFLTVFHLNVFVFTIPICVKFRYVTPADGRKQPLIASLVVCASISLFKAYPSIADVTLYLGLISMHFELFKYSPHLYVAIAGLAYASLLGPLFFNSWVYNGGGNANFFYAITLVWAVSQIVLVVDLLYAHLKREWERLHPGWRRMRVELLYQYS